MEKSHNDPFVFRTATSLLFLSFLFFFSFFETATVLIETDGDIIFG